MKRPTCLSILLLCTLSVFAHFDCVFTHYSTADGLSQNSVKDILQTSNGMMWFSTWDGLNRFDGYSFKVYKGDEHTALSNNRLEQLFEDRYGFLWIRDFNNHIFRFDPISEKFESIEKVLNMSFNCSSLYLTSSGHAWLHLDDGGIIKVDTDEKTYRLSATLHIKRGKDFQIGQIFEIHSDSSSVDWILTDKGLFSCDNATNTLNLNTLKSDQHKAKAFYSYHEFDTEIWLASDAGTVFIYNKASRKFASFRFLTKASIKYFRSLGEDNVFVSTDSDGFYIYNKHTKKSEHYNRRNHPSLPSDTIETVYADRKGGIWLDLKEHGTARFDSKTKSIRTYRLNVEKSRSSASSTSFKIFEDINGFLWVQPSGGGFSLYDWNTGHLNPFYNKEQSPESKYSNKLHTAFSDRQGNLWISAHSKGLERVSFSKQIFNHQPICNVNYMTLKNNVRALYLDTRGRLWAGTRDGMLHVYDKQNRYIGYMTQSGQILKSGPSINASVYTILEDSDGDFWFGTRGQGLFHAKHTDKPETFDLKQYLHQPNNTYSLSCDNIYALYQDEDKNIWIGTFDSGINLIEHNNKEKNSFINMYNRLINYPVEAIRIRCISPDKYGNLVLGTTSGVVILNKNRKRPEAFSYKPYSHVPGDSKSVSNNDIIDMCRTSMGEIYFVTMGGGLNKLVMDNKGNCTFETYTTRDGLASNVLMVIKEDHSGNLWIASENELCKFDIKKKRAETYSEIINQKTILFNESTALITDEGRIILGTDRGLVSFMPGSIQKSSYVPKISFTQLQLIDGKDIPLNTSNYAIRNNQRVLDKLDLTHKQSSFTISFAALDYGNAKNIKYAYRLKGADNEWRYLDNLHSVNYISLPHGDYQFEVRSTNSEGVWVDNTQALKFTIRPAWWQTSLAYILYLIGIMVIIVVVSRVLFIIYRLKHKVKIEKQISEIKLRFFTDISHELRTPLTLITAPVEHLLDMDETKGQAREYLNIVEKNTKRMLHLVNQILDFRKLQNKKMKMRIERVDIIPFIKQVMSGFDLVASEQHIHYTLICHPQNPYLWLDADKAEKIIFNLLSNAFKFTDPGKNITVIISESNETISISVQDQGIGIEESKINSLFDRFEHLLDKDLFNQPSSGIGLSIVKELAELHKATISVQSIVAQGSCFSVSFQKGKTHYTDVDFIVSDTIDSTEHTQLCTGNPTLLDMTILIVEDNFELRQFLKSIFSGKFNILEAENGETGISIAMEQIPDIIISDLMMPQKDGSELVRTLKNDLSTSHIPIIILTAKDTMDQRLDSLYLGADDYIVKPFSTKYLEARINNLLQLRAQLYKHYLNNQYADKIIIENEITNSYPYSNLSESDITFLSKLKGYIKEHISMKLHIDDLSQKYNMSRSAFFKKVKAMTGTSPSEIISDIKLKEAISLMKDDELSIAEISFMVGIDDAKYFSRIFKQKYNMSPREYRNSIYRKEER